MPIPIIYYYMDGKLRQAGSRGFLAVELPGALIAEAPLSTKSEVERAVESGVRACPACRQASASGRAEP